MRSGHVAGVVSALCCAAFWSVVCCHALESAACGIVLGSVSAECCRVCIVHVNRSAGNPTLCVLPVTLCYCCEYYVVLWSTGWSGMHAVCSFTSCAACFCTARLI
jgi:hypothetical protein